MPAVWQWGCAPVRWVSLLPHSATCAIKGLSRACVVDVASSAYCRRGQWRHRCGCHGTVWIGYQQMAHEPQVLSQPCRDHVSQGDGSAAVDEMACSRTAVIVRPGSGTAGPNVPDMAWCLTCESFLSSGSCRVVENGTFDAFWDTISFGFNGLVFFFAGASATNFAWRSTQVSHVSRHAWLPCTRPCRPFPDQYEELRCKSCQ